MDGVGQLPARRATSPEDGYLAELHREEVIMNWGDQVDGIHRLQTSEDILLDLAECASQGGSEQEKQSLDAVDVVAALGPPLEFLPKDIELDELQRYRADYQAFRAGQANGARGEINNLGPHQIDSYSVPRLRSVCHRRARKSSGRRYVPLIGLNLSASSAALSALSAAAEHHADAEDPGDFYLDEASAADASEAGVRSAGFRSPLATSKTTPPSRPTSPAAIPGRRSSMPFEPSEASFEMLPVTRHNPTATLVHARTGVGLAIHILASLVCLLPCFLHPNPQWLTTLGPPVGYAISVWCSVLWIRAQTADDEISHNRLLGHVLRMDRLIKDGCVPKFFPILCGTMYALNAWQLALGRQFPVNPAPKRSIFYSSNVERHDYSCWGSEQEDVADCVLIRHAGTTVMVSLYTCLLVLAVCNRNVKGLQIVAMHRQSLLDLFPAEAPMLFSYVERSVESNTAHLLASRRHRYSSIGMSFVWTLLSFSVYCGLLEDAKALARTVFFMSWLSTFTLQFVLLRHVLLWLMMHLEAVKARAAAMAYCDEEGVLPFTSAHSIYVWFSVRRNVQTENEVAYQRATPIVFSSVFCAAACSCLVASELFRQGLSIFKLTSRGGVALMIVASAFVSCVVVAVFLGALLDIGKLEEAHVRQLRIAHLRLEHAKCQKATKGLSQRQSRTSSLASLQNGGSASMSAFARSVTCPTQPPAEAKGIPPFPSLPGNLEPGTPSFGFGLNSLDGHRQSREASSTHKELLARKRSKESGADVQAALVQASTPAVRQTDFAMPDPEIEDASTDVIDGALTMIERVLVILENYDPRPTMCGVEIGSKSFRVVYAALLSNGWYLLVWGVLIPLMCTPKEESGGHSHED